MKNFRKNIKYLSKNFKKQNNIEYLFVGTWPAFKNRLSRNNRDIQLKVLINYLKKNKQQQSKIYIKHHPKFKLELIRDDKIKFKSLSKKLNDAPLEIIINSLSGIKEIYAFPSTSLYLINFLKLKKVKINIFIKKDSFAYAYQLKDIFDNKSFNLIYI